MRIRLLRLALIASLFGRMGASHAAPPPEGWAGLPLRSGEEKGPLPGFNAADLHGSTEGWTAWSKMGLLRVFVAPDARAADWWCQQRLKEQEKRRPEPLIESSLSLDWAVAQANSLLIARTANVAFMIESEAEASEIASMLLAGLIPASAAPLAAPPRLQELPGGDPEAPRWMLTESPGVVALRYEGARPLPGPGLVFEEPPRAWVAWDAHGRAQRVEGVPGNLRTPWMGHDPAPDRPTAAPAEPTAEPAPAGTNPTP